MVREINISYWFIVDIVKCPTKVCREGTMFLCFLWKYLFIVSQLRDRIYLEVWIKYKLLLCKITMKHLSDINRSN